jgi:uncharacterized damage-inducible protein DinB
MNPVWRTALWQQYGAAIDMLDNAIVACPDDVWSDQTQQPQFWYVAFHTIFFLDLYLSETADGFAPPAPFTLSEMDPAGVVPERYTKDQLRRYLAHGRDKCRATIEAMTDEHAARHCHFDWLDISAADLLFYSMRHVQHHTGQLNLILRQRTNSAAPLWVRFARREEQSPAPAIR